MMRKFFFILCLLLTGNSFLFAQSESISLTSYYPSPFGAYDRMRLVPRAALFGSDCTAQTEGTLYYRLSTGFPGLYVCAKTCSTCAVGWQRVSDSTSVWTQAGNTVYPSDTTNPISIFVTDNSVAPPPSDLNTAGGGRALIQTQATSIGNYVSLTDDGAVEISRNNLSTGGYIDLKDSPGKDYDARLYAAGGSSVNPGDFHIAMPNVGDAFTINATGNVGIKTATADIDLAIGDNDTGFDTNAFAEFDILANGIGIMHFAGDGRARIGATTPLGSFLDPKLTVQVPDATGVVSLNGQSPWLRFIDTNTAAPWNAQYMIWGDGQLTFQASLNDASWAPGMLAINNSTRTVTVGNNAATPGDLNVTGHITSISARSGSVSGSVGTAWSTIGNLGGNTDCLVFLQSYIPEFADTSKGVNQAGCRRNPGNLNEIQATIRQDGIGNDGTVTCGYICW